jgi:hypothetical protein
MLLLGLATGLAFGFLLQRGSVTKYQVIVGQFLLANHTVLRTMLTAIVVGSAGVLAMHQLWGVKLHLKEATLWGNILGGGIFGVGMVVLGYCPGTGIGAIADGSRHAIWGVLGMLVGAAGYAEMETWIRKNILSAWTLGKVTIPQEVRVSPWFFVIGLAIISGLLFWWLRGKDVPGTTAPADSSRTEFALDEQNWD